MQHIHILGICGTFMGSLAQLAVAKGFKVTGCDANVYPPMSAQLEAAGIELIKGFDAEQLVLKPDIFVIGNAMSRGNPLVESILDQGLPYVSGPQWLHDNILPGKWVLAVSGTHGKTTTSSMLAWILEYANMSPGYLIGGVPTNFSVSARLGDTPYFVIEADEYDSAFFDKRSKFVHYQARTLIINNLEFDHADIFDELEDIQKQFHHLVRTVPNNGLIIYPASNNAVDEVMAKGCWSATQTVAIGPGNKTDLADWSVELLAGDGSLFTVFLAGQSVATISWSQLGQHNIANAVVAMAAARHVGVSPEIAAQALAEFRGVKRRMECLYRDKAVSIYDDFAHHPTAIETTLEGLRAKVGQEKIIVLIEPRSNTMRMGVHQVALASAFDRANYVLWYSPEPISWDIDSVIDKTVVEASKYASIDNVIDATYNLCQGFDKSIPIHIVIMSNGGFEGVHWRLIQRFK